MLYNTQVCKVSRKETMMNKLKDANYTAWRYGNGQNETNGTGRLRGGFSTVKRELCIVWRYCRRIAAAGYW